MTTIFLDIAKILLIDKLNAEKLRSQQADNSFFNSVGTIFGFGRNQDLSKKKQSIVDTTVFNIKQFEGSSSDAENLKELLKIIGDCREEAKKASTENHKGESEHGKAMVLLKMTLGEIYDSFRQFETLSKGNDSDKGPIRLLDIPKDNDPSNLFNYYLALYLAKRKEQFFYPKKELFGFSFSVEALGIDKERLVIYYLKECAISLDRLDKQHADYKIERGIRVKSFLEKLITENEKLCGKYSWVPKIPVDFMVGSMSFNLPEIGPDSGFLEVCLERAKHEIDELMELTNENQPIASL